MAASLEVTAAGVLLGPVAPPPLLLHAENRSPAAPTAAIAVVALRA
ncbi:MAG TPA: hypothetical protein VGL26_01425 [Jatrophihabitans sp.]